MSTAPVSTTGTPGRPDVVLTLHQQPAGDVRGPFGRIFDRDPVAPAARDAFGRATGARQVGRLLDGLGPGWVAVHSVPVGGRSSDAGHVAVGPPGLLVVTSAHHRVKNIFVAGHEVFVNREKVTTLAVAETAADRVQRAVRTASGVDVTAIPVIVFVDPKRLVVREKPARTRVFTDLLLRRRLRRLPQTLTGSDLETVQSAVVADGTWAAPLAAVTPEQAERFGQLERSATTARRLRAAWRWAAAVVLLSATLLLVQGVALGIIG